LTNAAGQAVPAAVAARLANNKDVEIILSGPNASAVPVPCSWNATSLYFQCNLKTPAKVKEDATYYITALENVTGGFRTAPSYSGKSFDMNPEPITFK
jgi:hypothetical protein